MITLTLLYMQAQSKGIIAAMGMVRACMPVPLPALPAAAHSTGAAEKKPSRGGRRVLVLGGTGRVGWSTATALSKLRPDLRILIGGRNRYMLLPLSLSLSLSLSPRPIRSPIRHISIEIFVLVLHYYSCIISSALYVVPQNLSERMVVAHSIGWFEPDMFSYILVID